eukprot:15224372-Alexandrium_andersonii.AAC.1
MSASLVGSEMCIRDRRCSAPRPSDVDFVTASVVPICTYWARMRIGLVCRLGALWVASALRVQGSHHVCVRYCLQRKCLKY